MAPWAASLLRYHAISLPAVLLALAMLKLSFKRPSMAASLLPAIVVPAMSMVPSSVGHSNSLLSSVLMRVVRGLGLEPWLPMAALEVCLVTVTAQLLLLILSAINVIFTAAVRQASPLASKLGLGRLTALCSPSILVGAAGAAAMASSALHPGAPALLCVLMYCITRALNPQKRSKRSGDAASDWLLAHVIGALPAAVWLSGSMASGSHPHLYPAVCLERGCMLVNGLHACFCSWRLFRGESVPRPRAAACWAAAGVAAVYGLLGHVHVAVVAWSMLCSWALISHLMR